jgi:predicted nucleic acid-binding protein
MKGEFTAVTSAALLTELRRVLVIARSLTGWTDDEIRDAVDHIARRMLVVPGHILDLRQIVPADAEDNPLFEAALEADAGFVVTEDKAVLDCKHVALAGYRGIEVVAPRPFLKVLVAG